MNVLPPTVLVDWLTTPRNLFTALFVVVGLLIMWRAFARLMASRRAEAVAAANAGPRRKVRLDDVSSRWQLLLLATTGFVLSLASGYTTWMGMTNFTGEKTLSLMVTFGIQGVMLIVAWLIGESFATGMNRRLPDGRPGGAGRADQVIGIGLAVLVVAFAFYWLLHSSGTIGVTKAGAAEPINWARFADVSAYFALALIVIAVLAFNFSRDREGSLALPYVQSSRIIIKNAVLWVMFLACMATSVFFSFDSLFTAIFPKEERVRAAQLRAQNQVAGMVADIGSTIDTRRQTERDALFRTKGWTDYDGHLTRLAERSQGAQAEIEAYFNKQIEDKNRAIKQQQERIASAHSGSAGLLVKKNTLTDEIARLKGERPALAADFAEKKSELDNRARGVDAKRVEAQAEDRGAEGTLKQGKGPVYRTLMTELARLQDAYKIQETRVRDSQQRLGAADTRIAQLERELAAVDGELAKLKGEAETAQQRIKLTQDNSADDGQPRMDPSRVQPAFERARLEFRQEPAREKLTALHQQCSMLFTAMVSTPATRDRVRGIDCDPKQATEAAGVMFALNDGLKAFEAGCAGGDKLEAHKTTDALYGFARKCLADSGLPARETDQLRTQINFLELSRDDKAHPFVATLNAFQDGNRLAYLALGIAVAMDLLVFMSGLFGANAVRSPLSDVPTTKARSGRQLEAIVENALLPDTFDNARAVLNAMRPMTPRDGFTGRVTLHDGDPHASDVRRVLNAAATIGAVRHVDTHDEIYEVRSELFEYLSVVAKKAFDSNEENARLAELRKVVAVALQPHVGDHVDVVLHHCRPISERNGFSTEIFLSRMPADDAFVVQKVLNAGATLNYVQLDERPDQDQRYYLHKQLYKTLLLISSAAHRSGERSRAPQLAAPEQPGMANGGRLDARQPALAHQKAQRAALASTAPASAPKQSSLSDAEIRNEYWSRLVSALDLDPDVAARRLSVPGLSDAAASGWGALHTHGRGNRRLGDLLDHHRQHQDEALRSEYNLISEEIRGDRRSIDLLSEIDENVQSHLPALMMFPENGLLSFIVASIEQAAQHDDGLAPGEQALKDRLKGLLQDMGHLNLEKPSDWNQLKDWIEDSVAPDRPNVLRLAERRQRQ